ncbi:MAG TPA: hypothetical protein VLK25_05585 [Allosphingosinicella sp.]|nr:hypothetical protein [Allosphingosinicella sp.]
MASMQTMPPATTGTSPNTGPVPNTTTTPPEQTATDAVTEPTQQPADATEAAAEQTQATDAAADTAAEAQAQTQVAQQPMPQQTAPAETQTTATAQTQTQAGAAMPAGQTTLATAADVQTGVQVRDTTGGLVGTIESVDASGAVVSTGTARAKIPVASFGRNGQGLVLSMTKAQLEAAVAAQRPSPS